MDVDVFGLPKKIKRKKMIIAELTAGMGNQMFQYAAARRLAYVHRTELKLDVTHFNRQILRKYSLNYFNIQENFSTKEEINKYKPWQMKLSKRIISKIKRMVSNPHHLFVEEKFYHFDPKILNLPNDVYLSGFWQSDKYFKDIEDTVRKDLTIKIPQTGKNKELAETISSCQSVSIHIRRSDYLTDPAVYKKHGVCDLDYYFNCIKLINKEIKNPIFFIFSDDCKWVQDNFRTGFPTIVISHNNSENAFEDLRLMSQCKHNIIANSSFSWWAAWLNSNKNKIVFTPKIWFRNMKLNDKDLIPDGWYRI